MRIRALVFLAAACAFLAGSVVPANAAETWSVRSGEIVFNFTESMMGNWGLSLSDVQETVADPVPEDFGMEGPYWSFAISPETDLTFSVNHSIVGNNVAPGSGIAARGGMGLRDSNSGIEGSLRDFVVRPVEGFGTLRVGTASGTPVFDLVDGKVFFERESSQLVIAGHTVQISNEYAALVGRPELAGRAFGQAIIRADADWVGGVSTGEPPAPVLGGSFRDVALGILSGITEWDRSGIYPNGISALSMSTTSCNLGDVDVPWLAPMQEDHPCISMHLYREQGARLEMIGQSYMKHGFFALSSSQCTPCQHPSGGSFLGVGCSDTYGSGNNADRNWLGPRSEWLSFPATWECTGSHFSGGVPDCSRRHGSGGHGPTDHRLQVADADLDNPGASYIYEAYYLVRDDDNKINNVGHRGCAMSWSGSSWNFSSTSGLVEGPALLDWGQMRSWASPGIDDGNVILAVQTTDLGGGVYNYEYALYNFDCDRRIRSFSVPVGTGTVSNIGFHDVDFDGGNDWAVDVSGGMITFYTDTYDVDPDANALSYGLQYNFRFDVDETPVVTEVTLGLFTPPPADGITAITTRILSPPAIATSVGELGAAPGVRLAQNQPNPVGRTATTIAFTIGQTGPVSLDIYDTQGRRVRSLVNESREAGTHQVRWDGRGDDNERVAPGVYYYRLSAGGAVEAKSMIVVE